MEKSRIVGLTMIVLILMTVLIPSTIVWAEEGEESVGDSEILPGDPIESPFFKKFPPEEMIIDGVPNEDPSWGEAFEVNLFNFVTFLLDTWFYIYLWFIEFSIRIINWAFDVPMTNEMISILEEVMPSLEETVWDEFWFVVVAFSFLAIVIWWGIGDEKKALSKFMAMLIILAMAPAFFSWFPDMMKQTNEVTTIVSSNILAEVTGLTELEQEDKEDSVVVQDNPYQNERTEAAGITWFSSEELDKTIKTTQAIHRVDDSLWKGFGYESYLISNFGDKQLGKKHFEGLMKYGTDKEKRRDYLKKVGGISAAGKTNNEAFKVFTVDGMKERIKNVASTTMLPVVPVLAMSIFAFGILYHKVLAIAFGALMVVYALIALWPNNGLGDFAHYAFKTLLALCMQVFYTIVLSVFLKIWLALQDPERFPSMNLGGRVIMTALIIFAFWMAVKAVRNKVEQMRGVFGGNAQQAMGTSVNELEQMEDKTKSAARTGYRLVRDYNMMNNQNHHRPEKGEFSPAKQDLDENWISMRKKPQPMDAKLSSGAEKVAGEMYRRKLNPLSEEDRRKFVEKRPDLLSEVGELDAWLKRPLEQQFGPLPDFQSGKQAPPEPPKPGTAAYLAWKNSPQIQQYWPVYSLAKKNVHDQSYQRYIKKRRQRESSVFFRLLPKPQFNPDQIPHGRVMKEYRRLLKTGLHHRPD